MGPIFKGQEPFLQCNNRKERDSNLLRGGSLKLLILYVNLTESDGHSV